MAASSSTSSAVAYGKRVKANNPDALREVRESIELKALPWIETLVVTYDKAIEDEVTGQSDGTISAAAAANDDLRRELAFYKQALNAAVQGQALARQSNLPFSRPSDFFAEMVKSDEHMERVRQTLLDQKAGLKASEDARKQRELKKYGKKVQVERQQERQRNKREFDEKVKDLKRKRKGSGLDGADDGGGDDGVDDEFNIRLETALADDERRQSASRTGRGKDGKPKMRRDARNAKFGYGGKKKYAKENTRESTDDFGSKSKSAGARRQGGASGAGARRAPAKRPGKARRAAAGGRR